MRVIVIAPGCGSSVLRMTGKINCRVDLLEGRPFVRDDEEFLLVGKRVPEAEVEVKPTKGLEVYDKAFYGSAHDKPAART